MESLSSDGVGRFLFLSLIAADGSGEGGFLRSDLSWQNCEVASFISLFVVCN